MSTGQGLLGNNMFAYCKNNPVCFHDPEGARPVGFGLQFDVSAGDETIGVEIVVYYDPIVSGGDGPDVVYYIYSGSELSSENLTFMEDMLGSLASITAIEAGSFSTDSILFAAKAFLEGANFSGSFFLIDGNENFKQPDDYSGAFETWSFTGTFMGKQAGMYYSYSSTCCTVGIKVGVNLKPGLLPLNISYSRTEYSDAHALFGGEGVMWYRRWLIWGCLLITVYSLSVATVCRVEAQGVDGVVSETPFVSHAKGVRESSICDYDATDDYVFFAYAEKIAVVDAYTKDGVFSFSLEFDFNKNGALSLRCEDGLLYVLSKKGNVFVFSGENIISQYTYEAARSLGYNWQWFEGKTRNIKFSGGQVIALDSEGIYTQCVPIPFDVIWSFYSTYSIYAAIGFALILTFWRKNSKKARQ